jgi:hypothetical protein
MNNNRTKLLAGVLAGSTLAFLIADVIGSTSFGFGFMKNDYCFKYLGCNAGFFGYDAIEHFLSGLSEGFLFLWLSHRSEKFDFLRNGSFWKNFLVLLGLVALVGVGWEIM